MIEAPIVHGIISCNTLNTNTLTFGNVTLTSIDENFDISSNNILQNSTFSTLVNNLNTPTPQIFFVSMSNANHSSGNIVFDNINNQLSTFSTGSVTPQNIIVPTSGSYHISTTSTSTISSSDLIDNSIKINTQTITRSSGTNILQMSTTIYLNIGDTISIFSNNSTSCESKLFVTLLKLNQDL